MEIINAVGAVSGCSSILGFLALIIKLGEWKARQEERLASHGKRIDSIEHKHDIITDYLNRNNELLAEIKVKVDLMYTTKQERRKGERND